ncbi:family 16 glycosylhydrolase, partial [Arthrospira platensis SPKY1]|nr:family 16 glycosylhydrolase [Arthrospira platensis SPKY1]
PEIDVVEAYSKDDNYNDYKRFQPNVHYGNGFMIGAVNIPLPKSLFYSSAPIKFGVEWQPDYMKFYYNGYLVKVIYDKKVLDSMNQPMRVIINSSVQESMCASDTITAFTSPKIYQ